MVRVRLSRFEVFKSFFKGALTARAAPRDPDVTKVTDGQARIRRVGRLTTWPRWDGRQSLSPGCRADLEVELRTQPGSAGTTRT